MTVMRPRAPLAVVRAFVALGDSFTEGLEDEVGGNGRHRGWADRVAESLAARAPGLQYANLAVRGRLLDQVVEQQIPRAVSLLDEAGLLSEAVVSFHAGGNDVLRPGSNVSDVVRRHRAAVHTLAEAGVTPLLFTCVERAGNPGRAADVVASRFREFNEGVRATATQLGTALADVAEVAALQDLRLRHADRLHQNAEGHRRVAAVALDAVSPSAGHEQGWWLEPLPIVSRRPVASLAADARWAVEHLLPWALRRLRGVSRGDGIQAKHDELVRL